MVLAPNYRGSKGYGRAFMEKLYGDWGGGDLEDYLTGAQMVIDGGLVNPRKVIAMGGSAGGYSTLICMTKAPDFFRSGVCRFGIGTDDLHRQDLGLRAPLHRQADGSHRLRTAHCMTTGVPSISSTTCKSRF